jgi:hypothetical protein
MKAFPTLNWVKQHGQPPNEEGMELRDYFAAKAMQALLKRYYAHEIFEQEYTKDVYKASYFVADEMMKARK